MTKVSANQRQSQNLNSGLSGPEISLLLFFQLTFSLWDKGCQAGFKVNTKRPESTKYHKSGTSLDI